MNTEAVNEMLKRKEELAFNWKMLLHLQNNFKNQCDMLKRIHQGMNLIKKERYEIDQMLEDEFCEIPIETVMSDIYANY